MRIHVDSGTYARILQPSYAWVRVYVCAHPSYWHDVVIPEWFDVGACVLWTTDIRFMSCYSRSFLLNIAVAVELVFRSFVLMPRGSVASASTKTRKASSPASRRASAATAASAETSKASAAASASTNTSKASAAASASAKTRKVVPLKPMAERKRMACEDDGWYKLLQRLQLPEKKRRAEGRWLLRLNQLRLEEKRRERAERKAQREQRLAQRARELLGGCEDVPLTDLIGLSRFMPRL